MRKRTKLRKTNSTNTIPQLIKIEQAISCDLKKKLNEESIDVAKIKSDPNYVFKYALKITSVTEILVLSCIPTHIF